MKINKNHLERVLKVTKRNQFVSGKEHPQVVSCMLRADGDRLYTTSLVKDGKTSVAKFSMAHDNSFPFTVPIPDIDRLIGVLKYHAGEVKLESKDNKLVIRSTRKQTTMSASSEGRAYPNSSDTIAQWEDKSVERAGVISKAGYTMKSGEVRKPFYEYTTDADTLFDALRCDEMNGQRMNRYTFTLEDGHLSVVVGDHLKGKTDIRLNSEIIHHSVNFSATFGGGLEYVLKYYDDQKVRLQFYDFNKEGQGYRLCIWFENDDFVFQAGFI